MSVFGFISALCYFCAGEAPVHRCLLSLMRLNGRSVHGRFDDAVDRCIVSPVIAALVSGGAPLSRGIVQALFCGSCFTADVPVDIGDIDCDLVVGREWMALFRLVTDDRPAIVRGSRADVVPSSVEESSMYNSPRSGCISDASAVDPCVPLRTVSEDAAQRVETVRSLEAALHSEVSTSHPSSWTVFHSDVDVLARCCALHGIPAAISDGTGFSDALLRHFFTGMCMLPRDDYNGVACSVVRRGLRDRTDLISFLITSVLRPDIRYSTERLALIARAVGLVESGAKVERRKLVLMLEEFNLGCNVAQCDIGPDMLFSNIDRIARPTLLSLGCAHGISLIGGREDLLDALVLHITCGACAEHSRASHPLCVAVARHYMPGSPSVSLDNVNLQIRILDAVRQFIKLRPLKRLLRLQGVSFDPSSSLPRLRRNLRTYVDRLIMRHGELEPQVSRPAWPVLVPDHRKTEIVRRFRQATSSEALKTFICAPCSAARSCTEMVEVGLAEVDLELLKRPDRRLVDGEIVHARWIDPQCVGPVFDTPHEVLRDVLVAREGVVMSDRRAAALRFCGLCWRCLRKGSTPDLSLANHLFLGDVPVELRGLTVVEEAMISRCRAKSWIIQLREVEGSSVPNAQRGMRGHIIVFPQDPERVVNLLPPPIEDIITPICVIFVGSSPPSKEWLRMHARPLIVRKERVFAALLWLQAHNPFYKDVRINRGALQSLDDEDVLPVPLEVIPPSFRSDSLTARYDTALQSHRSSQRGGSGVSEAVDVFETVIVANVDPDAPSHVLRAAAMEHIAKMGKGYVQVPHGARPVGDINNPAFFPLIYPTLFPYGLGAPEEYNRRHRVSLKRHVKHWLELSDPRFQTHYSFIFTVFNVLQKRSILLHSSLKINRGLFDTFRSDFAKVSPSAVHAVAERLVGGDHTTCFTGEEKRVRELLKQVSHVTTRVQGSSSSRVLMRNEIRALMIEKGLPSFYVTTNPADVYSPIVKFMSGGEFDLDAMLPEDVPDFWSQSILVAKNPVVASRFFHLLMTAFIRAVLCYDGDLSDASRDSIEGILGPVSAYYGCVEAQGRGSEHTHWLIWLSDSLNSDQIKQRVLGGDIEFRDRLVAFLDDTISSSIPEDPLPEIDIPSSVHHPCSVRGPPLVGNDDDPGVLQKRKKDVHHLATACQVHRHTATCFKYWKGPPEPRECRFGLDEKNFVGRSSVDEETGDLHLRYMDGMVNRYNETILECLRCNMDIQFVGTGRSAKAVLYYITDYITKTQLKAHVAYSALDVAVRKLGDYDPSVDDLRLRAKRLLQKCAHSMISHQELSAQQVCSYLLEHGDHHTSHSYQNLYWISFEGVVERELPSPECYQQVPVSQPEVGDDQSMGSDDDSESEQVDASSDQSAGSEDDSESEVSDDPVEDTVPSAEDYMIGTDGDGNLVPHTNQVDDYRYRPCELGRVCLWDFCAQVDKILKRSRRSAVLDGTDTEPSGSDCSESEVDVLPPSLDSFRTRDDVLKDCSYRRPSFPFLSHHVEHRTRQARVRHPQKRYVPVPIGPGLPRGDRDETKARHARLMLILFKPWQCTLDLRGNCNSWTDAYDAWVDDQAGTFPCHRKLVDNIQAIQECKDVRDDDMARHRQRGGKTSERHVPPMIVAGGHDEHLLSLDDGGDDGARMQLLTSLEESRTWQRLLQQNTSLECVHHLEQSGRFDLVSIASDEQQARLVDPCNEHDISGSLQTLEDEWEAAYCERLERSRRWLLAEEPYPPDGASLSGDARPEVCTLDTETGSGVKEFHRNRLVFPIVANIGQASSVTRLQPVADLIAEEFSLNVEQRRAFALVSRQAMQDRPPPLRMFIGGPGGTGKTRVVHAIQEFFTRTGQARRFQVCSFMGVAARNVSGSTLHAALNLNERRGSGYSAKSRRDLIAKWEGVDFLLVDEVSVIGRKMLVSIHEALCIAKGNDLPFGGVNIVFAGDFAQLPPVGQRSLYCRTNGHNVSTPRAQSDVFGRLLWLSVDVVVLLTQVLRQSGNADIAFVELLSRLRIGRCTDDDYRVLQSRLLRTVCPSWDDDAWLSAPILVSSNDAKDALNQRATFAFARRAGRPLHWYESADCMNGTILSADESVYLHRLHSGETQQRLGRIPLVIGMPVMITQNFDVESGIVNGCVGTLVSVRYTVDSDGRRHAVSCVIRTPSTTDQPLPHLQPHESVVIADTVDVYLRHPFHGGDMKFKRTQVPILPGFAMTVHKSQGSTMERVIVDLEGSKGTESPYVMLSRVKSLAGLVILRPFSNNRITCRQSEDVRRETKRLEILNLLTLIHDSEGAQRAQAESDLSTLTGGPCRAMTVASQTLTACLLRTCDVSTVLDDIEQSVTLHCSASTQVDPPRALQRRPLKRRAVTDPEDDNRYLRRTRSEY